MASAWRSVAGLALVVLVFAVLGLMPVVRLLVTALFPQGALDLAGFLDTIGGRASMRALARTLDTAFFGALLSLAIGGPLAFLVTLTDMPMRRTIGFLLLLPLMIAPQVMALAWLHLLGPSSALLGMLGLAAAPGTANPLLGREGIIMLYGVQHAPIVFIAVRAGLVRVPAELLEAARAAGASATRATFHVVVPLLRPYLVAAVALAFVSGLGNFGIPALLGMPVNYNTLTTLIYQRISSFGPRVLPDVAAIATLIAVLCLAGALVQARVLGPTGHRVQHGRAVRLRLGRRGPVAALVALIFLTLVLVLPFAALVATSLVPALGVRLTTETLTLSNYVEVMARQASTQRAFVNSFVLSGGAALVLALMAVPIAQRLERAGPRLRAGLAAIGELPYAIPGIVLALACILLFIRPLPLIGSLYATAWIILVAYLMRFFTLALKPVSAAAGQLPRELGEAAAAAGAGPATRLATIFLPLLAPAAVGAALLVFMSAFNELTVSALLWSGGNETLGVVLFGLSEAGLAPLAAAIGVATVVVVALLLLLLDRLGSRLPPGVLPWR